ncbi:MAG: tetratricopeptide repeat protein [bacterium]|nr:tetratricopeptide repeat protein [bacterium]
MYRTMTPGVTPGVTLGVIRTGLVLALLSSACLAHADVLILKDGRILERDKMEGVPEGVKVHFENGVILIPKDAIQTSMLSNPPEPTDLSDADKASLAKGLVHFEGKWMTPAKRDKLFDKMYAARKAEVEKLRHHSLWRNRHKKNTKHFKFEYTVAPFVYEYYEQVMEAYYKAFAKTWKIKQTKDLGKLKVCFYTDAEKFWQIGGVSRGVLGYFRFVKPIELNFFYSRVDPEQTEQVMYHEANHYLQKLLKPDFSMPHFPGEAIAEYYGASKYDPKTKKLTTGLVLEGRLTEVKTDIAAGNMQELEPMIKTDGMYKHYTWGWTLAHFLMNDKRYAKKFQKFVKGLPFDPKVKRVSQMAGLETVAPEEVLRYFKKCLGLKDSAQAKALEAEWHDYIKNTLKAETTRGLELAAYSAMRVGRPIRAKRLFKEAIAAGSDHALTYYRYGDLLSNDGKSAQSIKMFRKALELGPLESEFYASLGRALVRNGEKDEGIRYMKLSLELDPDNPWLAESVEQFQKDEALGK